MSKLLLAYGLIALGATALHAETFPARPLRLVVPYAAGGSTDVLARLVGQKLSETLGQPVVIDNRTGAGTLIATEIVAHAAPDGYTLLMATPPLVVADALYKSVPFDVARDFAAVTNVAATSNVLVVHPSLPAKSVKELIALAKAKPGQIVFGSAGNGTSPHLSIELLLSMTGTRMLHVPYKGPTPALIDLLGGRVSVVASSSSGVVNHVRSGRLRALGVTTAKRAAALPDMSDRAHPPPVGQVGHGHRRGSCRCRIPPSRCPGPSASSAPGPGAAPTAAA